MAKATKKKGSGENVAAALDTMESHYAAGPKAHATVKSRIAEQDSIIEDLEERLATAEETKRRELQAQADKFTRENTALAIALDTAKDKLRKVGIAVA